MTEGGRNGRGWGKLATAAAIATYLLIVLGGVVRITGSGMGCGDDWPLCNGQLIPPMDLPTLIEYGHRLAAAGVGLLVAALAAWAWWGRRRGPGWSSRARLGGWALGLLVVQVLLGAITVRLELPPWSVILHLGTAMALLAVLVLSALAAGEDADEAHGGGRAGRMAWSLAGLAAVVVLLGALVANLGAAAACQGFPLCNGSLFPSGHWRIGLHWTHRLAAYALVPGVLVLPRLAARARAGRPAINAAWAAAILAVAQIAVAAWMVLDLLPGWLRAAHVALGAALFAALIAHARLTRRPAAAS